MGFKEKLAPSGVLEKLINPQGHAVLAALPEKAAPSLRVRGLAQVGNSQDPHWRASWRRQPSGFMLKKGRPPGGSPGKGALSTSRSRPAGGSSESPQAPCPALLPQPAASLVVRAGPGRHQMKTLARASAPALAMRALLGWQATAWMASSCFLRCAVISCTHVLLSRLHRRREQS